MRHLRLVTEIAAPPAVCFDLSRSIDLHVESMQKSNERAVAGVTTGLIGDGQEVTWQARHFGVRWHMTSRITVFDPPRRFVDEMVKGPFASFRHEHVFVPAGTGTRMTDVVDVGTGWGPLLDAAARAYLRHLLTMRNATIRAKAEGGQQCG